MAEITIVQCETRAQMRAFLSVRSGAEKRGFLGREMCFAPAKAACDVAKNPILRAHRHAFLLGMKNGRPSARLLLVDGGGRAWFSLFVFDEEGTALKLLENARRIAAEWGAGEISGPVSPDGSGFDLGALMHGSLGDGAPWHPSDEKTAPVLEKAGFSPETVLAELEISVSEKKNPYAGAEAFAYRHGKITVRRMPLNSGKTCRAAFVCSEDAQALGYDAFARVCGRIVQLCRGAFALIAFAEDEPVGWILCVPEKGRRYLGQKQERSLCAPEKNRLRLLHMQIRTPHRRGPAAAALLERAWNEAAAQGVRSVRASTIDLDNEASLRMAKAAGGRVCHAYGVFLCGNSPETCE